MYEIFIIMGLSTNAQRCLLANKCATKVWQLLQKIDYWKYGILRAGWHEWVSWWGRAVLPTTSTFVHHVTSRMFLHCHFIWLLISIGHDGRLIPFSCGLMVEFWNRRNDRIESAHHIKHTLLNSEAQDTSTWLDMVGESRQREVISTGRPGRLGSTPGLVVGTGFWNQKTLGYSMQDGYTPKKQDEIALLMSESWFCEYEY